MRVVVVGASLAGLRAAERLRAEGFPGEIVVLGAEDHPPYDRPPLTKAGLRTGSPLEAVLLPRRVQDITWRLGNPVVSADLRERVVRTQAGDDLGYDGLVVATGLRPRRLPIGTLGPDRRHVLRTWDDAVRLAPLLAPGRRLVVLGAGPVACEVASRGVDLGADVVLVAPDAAPMARAVGTTVGALLRRRLEIHGVRFLLGRLPLDLADGPAGARVRLDDGTLLDADAVVEAVGSVPNVEWLEGNRLDLRDGVRCDGALRVQGRPEVVACGDVAAFPSPRRGSAPARVEHWAMAPATARRAARSLADHLLERPARDDVFDPLPSSWSDQAGIRVQTWGTTGAGTDTRLLSGDPRGEAVFGAHAGAELVGLVALGSTAFVSRQQGLVAGLTSAA